MKKTVSTKPEPTPEPTSDAGLILTPALIEALRSAASIDAGLALLQPNTSPKPKSDAMYVVNATSKTPLPQKRGACLKVVLAAVRLNRPFKVADITAALPDLKSAAFWTRKLAKTGHLIEATK